MSSAPRKGSGKLVRCGGGRSSTRPTGAALDMARSCARRIPGEAVWLRSDAIRFLWSMEGRRMRILIKGAGDLATGVAVRLKRAGFEVAMTDLAPPDRRPAHGQLLRGDSGGRDHRGSIRARRAADGARGASHPRRGGHRGDSGPGDALSGNPPPPPRWWTRSSPSAIPAQRFPTRGGRGAGAGLYGGGGLPRGGGNHARARPGPRALLGCAHPNTGVPGEIGGYTVQRLLRAPADGRFEPRVRIGDSVRAGDLRGNGRFRRR